MAFCQVDYFQNVIAYFAVELYVLSVHSQCSSPINTKGKHNIKQLNPEINC